MRLKFLVSFIALALWGCPEDGPDVVQPPPAGPGEPPPPNPGGEEPPPAGETPPGGEEPPPPGGETPPTPVGCNEYSYRGMTYNCGEVDLCSPDGVDPVVASICAQCYGEIGFPGWANQPCPEIDCEDGEDNDNDGYTDCADQDCSDQCPEPEPNDCSLEGACEDNPECADDPICNQPPPPVESCMSCHNGAETGNNYTGGGITNPHPFGSASQIRCTQCHGGDGQARTKLLAHVPPPPEVGDRQKQIVDPKDRKSVV